MRSSTRSVALLLVAAAAISCSGKGGEQKDASAETATADTSAQAAADEDRAWRQEWRKRAFAGSDPEEIWARYSRAAQAELSKPGADPSDIASVAGALDHDPQKIFEFIRDHVALEPYAGVLRGARGTLLSGSGNALDRALLAQELLNSAGYESRLVAGTLSDAQADGLLAKFLTNGPVPDVLSGLDKPTGDSAVREEAAKLTAMLGLDDKAAVELLQHAVARGRKFLAATDARSTESFKYLSDRLKNGNVKMAVDSAALTATLKDRLRKHYWVQVKGPQGAWSHFDTAMPDAVQGTAYGAEPAPLAEVPREEFHQLEFGLVYLTTLDGAIKEDVLVSGTFASADALFEPLEFRVQAGDLSADADALASMTIKKKIETLKAIKRFQGILRSGGKVSVSRYFDLEGNLYDEAGPSLPITGGTFVDAFGGGGESTPQFLELRVVMRLTGPGRQPMAQVRTLVRSQDTQSPAFAPPIIEWELLLQPQWISAAFVSHRSLGQIIAVGSALESASAERPLGSMDPPSSALILPLQVALIRQVAAAGILAQNDGLVAFVDEPMLMISGFSLGSILEDRGLITTERSIDIVENAVRYVPRSDTAQVKAYEAALRQSVADSTIEDHFLRQAFPDSETQSGTTIFSRGIEDGRQPLLARVQDIDAMRSAGMTEPDIEWIYDNEHAANRLLVSTSGDGLDAWWSVRPDGNAILRVNGGRGSAMTEKVLITAKIGFAAVCLFHFGRAEYNAQSGSGGVWSPEDADRVEHCLLMTTLAGGLFGVGLVVHAAHWASAALALYEAHDLWNFATS